jgi:hypothetical protein
MNKGNTRDLFIWQEAIPWMGSMWWTTIVINEAMADAMKQWTPRTMYHNPVPYHNTKIPSQTLYHRTMHK